MGYSDYFILDYQSEVRGKRALFSYSEDFEMYTDIEFIENTLNLYQKEKNNLLVKFKD